MKKVIIEGWIDKYDSRPQSHVCKASRSPKQSFVLLPTVWHELDNVYITEDQHKKVRVTIEEI